jgi:RHS repeat-associated protein
MASITNNRDTGRNETFTYDQLNRLTSAQSQATSGADCWGQSIPSTGYDRYGNLLTINSTQCSSPALSLSVSNKNRLTNSGFTYDNAGNLTFDGLYNYTWDAENHLKSANGVNYTSDGDLRRVEKSNGKLYWYSTGGQILEETDLNGNLISDYVYLGGKLVWRRDASRNVYFYFTDPLGTARGIYTSGSSLCYDADFYPFGGEKVFTNTCAQNYKFTGLERDAESGLDDTLNRKYSSNLGRWLETDPVRGCPAHAQSLNRYAYVLNNPTTLTDPLGLGPWCTWDEPDCNPLDPCAGQGWVSNPACSGPGSGGDIWFSGPPGDGGGSRGGGAVGGGGTAGSRPWPGNSGFPNGSAVCVTIDGVLYPCVQTNFPGEVVVGASLGAIIGALQVFLHRPWVIGWILPVIPEIGVAGAGPAGSLAFNPDTHTGCVSIGFGAAAGHDVAVGPITHAVMFNGTSAFPRVVSRFLWKVSSAFSPAKP